MVLLFFWRFTAFLLCMQAVGPEGEKVWCLPELVPLYEKHGNGKDISYMDELLRIRGSGPPAATITSGSSGAGQHGNPPPPSSTTSTIRKPAPHETEDLLLPGAVPEQRPSQAPAAGEPGSHDDHAAAAHHPLGAAEVAWGASSDRALEGIMVKLNANLERGFERLEDRIDKQQSSRCSIQ